MSGSHSYRCRGRTGWHRAWPCWALLACAGLAAVSLLPGGYGRALVAMPIALAGPGALTLGALFGPGHRLPGAVFACFAALLGMAWPVFVSLALGVLHVPLTAASTYWALLAVCAVLAAVAQTRLLRAGASRARTPATAGGRYYALAAVVAGAGLLAGGLYGWDHLRPPGPPGYTRLAWAGGPQLGTTSVGPHGRTLPFEIVHRQQGTGIFQVRAVWQGDPSRPLARPMTVQIGPGRTFRGALFVPHVPGRCTYRIAITVTGVGQRDLLAKQPSWAINADVRGVAGPGQPGGPDSAPKMCRS